MWLRCCFGIDAKACLKGDFVVKMMSSSSFGSFVEGRQAQGRASNRPTVMFVVAIGWKMLATRGDHRRLGYFTATPSKYRRREDGCSYSRWHYLTELSHPTVKKPTGVYG